MKSGGIKSAISESRKIGCMMSPVGLMINEVLHSSFTAISLLLKSSASSLECPPQYTSYSAHQSLKIRGYHTLGGP